MRIPDEQLNHHAERYLADRIGAHGVRFEDYLADPARYDPLALQPEPLLPAQAAVAQRLAHDRNDPAQDIRTLEATQ